MRALAIALAFAAAAGSAGAQQQVVDPAFRPAVAHPAFAAGKGPRVAIDEAHDNLHTVGGNYRPFAELLRADGYVVVPSASRFTAATFKGVDVFCVVNAEAPFSADEATALRDWVKAGGSLLLTADHAPYGEVMHNLGEAFGVDMGKGFAFVVTAADGPTTILDYKRGDAAAGGELGQHPILEGRNASERIGLVRAFTGESLSIPKGARPLLRIAKGAKEAPDRDSIDPASPKAKPIVDRAQGLAMSFGKGRVVVMGEAGMFSAQVVTFPDNRPPVHFGMNIPGTDDKQLALNVVHWLSRLIG